MNRGQWGHWFVVRGGVGGGHRRIRGFGTRSRRTELYISLEMYQIVTLCQSGRW